MIWISGSLVRSLRAPLVRDGPTLSGSRLIVSTVTEKDASVEQRWKIANPYAPLISLVFDQGLSASILNLVVVETGTLANLLRSLSGGTPSILVN